MRRRNVLLLVCLSVVAAAAVTAAVMNRRGDKPTPADAPAPAVEAKGLLRPVEVDTIYLPREGRVVEIRAKPGDRIDPGFEVASLHSNELEEAYNRVQGEMTESRARIEAAVKLLSQGGLPDGERLRVMTERRTAEARVQRALEDLRMLEKQYNAGRPNRSGYFRAVAPPFGEHSARERRQWTVLTDDRRESLLGKTLRPNQVLMRLGHLEGPWHIELKIPQHHVGQVLGAFTDPESHRSENDPAKGERRYLPVDVFLSSHPETSYAGHLYREEIAPEAIPSPDGPGNEPVLPANVKLNLPGIPKERWIPTGQLVVGLESRVKFRFSAPPPK